MLDAACKLGEEMKPEDTREIQTDTIGKLTLKMMNRNIVFFSETRQ